MLGGLHAATGHLTRAVSQAFWKARLQASLHCSILRREQLNFLSLLEQL